jgi:hypothetical protein
MGLDYQGIRFLLGLRAKGVIFERTATIGRQGLSIQPQLLDRLLSEYNIQCKNAVDAARVRGFGEPLFKCLGAQIVDSLDASAYESATIIHDMNRPVPQELNGRYTTVFDGGSLEHVFNFPQSICNSMAMVAQGGHLILITPTNNFMGHGFYQFSPELFYRVLSRENGYHIDRMIACEAHVGAPWYEVADPAQFGHRVVLRNWRQTYLLICARRNEIVPLFSLNPQQSDYVMMWDGKSPPKNLQRQKLRRLIPEPLKPILRWLVWRWDPFDKRVFRKVEN